MKAIPAFFIAFIFAIGTSHGQESVKIYGKVTDFNGNPLDSAAVRLKNKNFENVYEVWSNDSGYYSMNVTIDNYYCLYAIRPHEYAKTKLEYWAWNIPAYSDLEINPQYQRMEMYGLNAFEPQVGPWNTYMVYFRPMSLTKGLKLRNSEINTSKQELSENKPDTIDIAPSQIKKDELQVWVNDIPSEVVNITKTHEYARGAYMIGYFIQIMKPEDAMKTEQEYDKISIILDSKETGDTGKGECFVKRIE